jgi:hypothetical protein
LWGENRHLCPDPELFPENTGTYEQIAEVVHLLYGICGKDSCVFRFPNDGAECNAPVYLRDNTADYGILCQEMFFVS